MKQQPPRRYGRTTAPWRKEDSSRSSVSIASFLSPSSLLPGDAEDNKGGDADAEGDAKDDDGGDADAEAAEGRVLFPGRHNKKRRLSCLKIVPFIQRTFRERGVNPNSVQPKDRRQYVKDALNAAVAADQSFQFWLGADRVYSSKAALERALLYLYWEDVVAGFPIV